MSFDNVTRRKKMLVISARHFSESDLKVKDKMKPATLDAHQRPPSFLRDLYKKYQKQTIDVDTDVRVIDFGRGLTADQRSQVKEFDWISYSNTIHASESLLQEPFASCFPLSSQDADTTPFNHPAYEYEPIPGLVIIPNLISPKVQRKILELTFYRDLLDQQHKTNVHLHYRLSYPEQGRSFFDYPASTQDRLIPIDPSVHKPLSVGQLMNKKLRWITLGGQYDWTNKVYPNEKKPPFPSDLSRFLKCIFPQTDPEAAIVNLYSPGDTLSIHRDVSEECGNGLVSISIGCDGLFVIGLGSDDDSEDARSSAVLRLRSGDAVYMTGPSRFAWHGVPVVCRNTCPSSISNWPCKNAHNGLENNESASTCTEWCGWMRSKRINLNVRQMRHGG